MRTHLARCTALTALPVALSVVLLLPASVAATSPPEPAGPPSLFGPWHTVSIDGDALFLVLRAVQVDLHEDGSFGTTIRFVDGTTETKNGTWKASGDRIDFSLPELGARESVTYRFEGKDLVIHDASFHISIRITRGALPPAKEKSFF